MLGRPVASAEQMQLVDPAQGCPHRHQDSPQPDPLMLDRAVASVEHLQLAEPMQGLPKPEHHPDHRPQPLLLAVHCPVVSTQPMQLADPRQWLLQNQPENRLQPTATAFTHQRCSASIPSMMDDALAGHQSAGQVANDQSHFSQQAHAMHQPQHRELPPLGGLQASMQQQQQLSEGTLVGSSQAPVSARKGRFSRLRLQPRAAVGELATSPSYNMERTTGAPHMHASAKHTQQLSTTQQMQKAQDTSCLAAAAVLALPAELAKAGREAEAGGIPSSNAGHSGAAVSELERMRSVQPQAAVLQQQSVTSEQSGASAQPGAASQGLSCQKLPALPMQAELQQDHLKQAAEPTVSIPDAHQTAPSAVMSMSNEPIHIQPSCAAVDKTWCVGADRTASMSQSTAVRSQHKQCASLPAQQEIAIRNNVLQPPRADDTNQPDDVISQHQQPNDHDSPSAAEEKPAVTAASVQPHAIGTDSQPAAHGCAAHMSQTDPEEAFADDWDWQQTQGVFGFDSEYQPSQAFASHDSHGCGHQKRSWHNIKPLQGMQATLSQHA